MVPDGLGYRVIGSLKPLVEKEAGDRREREREKSGLAKAAKIGRTSDEY